MRQMITALLERTPQALKLRYFSYLPSLRKWREIRNGSHRIFDNRESLYGYIAKHVLGNTSIDYFEFGIYQGASLRKWAQLNSNPDSRFYGFDTFTGLPEDWHKFSTIVRERTFDLGGVMPAFDDERISLFKGLFQETLPPFLSNYASEQSLVIHIDSDLYSAALYVLTRMDSVIKPGTIIIFDEFTSLLHEFRALEDYTAAYRRRYEVLASTNNEIQVGIRML